MSFSFKIDTSDAPNLSSIRCVNFVFCHAPVFEMFLDSLPRDLSMSFWDSTTNIFLLLGVIIITHNIITTPIKETKCFEISLISKFYFESIAWCAIHQILNPVEQMSASTTAVRKVWQKINWLDKQLLSNMSNICQILFSNMSNPYIKGWMRVCVVSLLVTKC